MTLTDPREALADQSNFVSYLMGLASLAQVVHALAADGERRTDPPRDADDFVHVLLGPRAPRRRPSSDWPNQLQPAPQQRAAAASALTETRWLR